ncbi:MAG: hypothetical protein OXH11_13895 [Candidatus Aminicenantes bacterium]|nr:hypothetical protein [Candidatus Aminicenantes bacterium]
MIRTVLGEIPEDKLGPALAHEHLYCNIARHSGNLDNAMTDWELIVRELGSFTAAGGRGILEVTPVDLDGDAEALRRISEASGVHIVRGIAFYQEDSYPGWLHTATVDEIEDFFVREIEEGGTGIPAGFIGEIGSHNRPEPDFLGYRLAEGETRVFQAAAGAQKRTGALISTHACLGRAGHAQLNVLEAAGADLSRVVIGHCDAHYHDDEERDLEYYLPILDRGAYVEFDLIGWIDEWPGCPTDEIRALRLASLVRLGYQDQLLVATDTCRLSHLRANGGRGYDYFWSDFLPRLRRAGVGQGAVDAILIRNPGRAANIS